MTDRVFKQPVAPSIEGMLRKQLTCPKCKDPICPPIYHCEKGHSFCNLCYKSGYDCTVCGSKCNGGRTHHLERIVELYIYVCKYWNKGCRKRCKIQTLRSHEEACQTFEMNCPFTFNIDCPFIGNRQQTVFHCQLVHNDLTFVGNGPLKFSITDQFIDSITLIQDKIRCLKRKKNMMFRSFYMLYVNEVIFQVVCYFELKRMRVAMYRMSSPSEIDDRYEFLIFFHNDDDSAEAFVTNECVTTRGKLHVKPPNKFHDEPYVDVDIDVLKLCRYCSVQIVEKN